LLALGAAFDKTIGEGGDDTPLMRGHREAMHSQSVAPAVPA